MTGRRGIQRLLALLLLLAVTVPGLSQLPPRPIDGKLGLQDERSRMILDERGRHILPDKPLSIQAILASAFAYYKFDDGSNLGFDSIAGSTNTLAQGTRFLPATNGIINGCLNYTNSLGFDFTRSSYGPTGWDWNNYTARLWVNTTNFPFSSVDLLFLQDSSSATHTWTVLELQDAGGGLIRPALLVDAQGGAIAEYDSPIAFAQSTWNQIVLSWTGQTLYLYVNGTNATNAAVGTFTQNGTVLAVSIGANQQATWAGKIDEFGLWRFAWTSDDARNDYNSGAGRTFP